jgi:hypothetical protein
MKLKILSVIRPKKSFNGVRLYAFAQSRENAQDVHLVVFIRKPGIHRWLCGCLSQLFTFTGRRRNCAHIRAVRAKVGK